MKRTPLKRKTGLKRTGFLRRANPAKKKEWEADRDWVLAVTWVWQYRESLGTDRCFCGLCSQFHAWDESTADHIDERATSPEKKWDWQNLQPAGRACNEPGRKKALCAKRGGEKDGRPERLKDLMRQFAAHDFEYGGRRPRIKLDRKAWLVTEALKAVK